VLARHGRERVDAVAPPVESAEQPHHDHLGVPRAFVDPEIDRHGVAQIAKMREPQAREVLLLNRIR
jgi:hypothetical protein